MPKDHFIRNMSRALPDQGELARHSWLHSLVSAFALLAFVGVALISFMLLG